MDVRTFRNIGWFKTVYYTFVSRRVHRIKQKWMLCYGGTILSLDSSANVDLQGNLVLGANKINGAPANCFLRMDRDSRLCVAERGFEIYYGSDIVLFPGAVLKLGSGFINSSAKVRCHASIEIGEGVAISHDFTVMDSDAHEGLWAGYRKTAPVVIGNHVWIGTRVTVLKGVTIGDGAIVAAGSVVTHDIPPHTLAAGIPARVIREHVDWRA